jgi:hypothetical protein
MTIRTLKNILAESIEYDSSLRLYAQRIDGRFEPASPASLDERDFEKGSRRNLYEYIDDGESIVDDWLDYVGARQSDPYEFGFLEEWNLFFREGAAGEAGEASNSKVIEYIRNNHPDEFNKYYEKAKEVIDDGINESWIETFIDKINSRIR